MRQSQCLELSFLILAGFATLLLFTGGRRASGQEQAVEQKLWGIYWTVEQGFTSTLEMKNNLPADPLSVRISLYFASGEEYPLARVQLGPRQTVVMNLNALMDSLPRAVAARAGKEGTLEVEYDAATPSALMGSLSVLNPRWHTAWNFFLYPRRLDAPKAPVRGLFWFKDEDSDGFVAVQNVSDEKITLTPRFEIGGQTFSLGAVQLAPDQGMKLELRRELRTLDLEEATAGGIELAYDGPSDAVKAHGVLFDRKGFSAEIDFSRYEELEEKQTLSLRTPRFAVGSADPELGLPPETAFEPVIALHNFHATPLDVNLAVGYADGETTRQFNIPLTIGPGDTRVLPLHSYLKDVLPRNVSWASLELTYSDSETGLAAAMVSVSKDGEHSLRSVLNWVQGSNREGWYWRADADHNTLVSILNTDEEPARVGISLDYYVDGVKHSYALPERTLAPKATSVVDIAGIIKAGLPDAAGEVISPSVTSGGYHVRKVGLHLDRTITTEALVLDRRAANFLTFYNTCCGYTSTRVIPDSFLGPIGFLGTTHVQGLNYCTGQWEDLTFSSTLSSSPTSIVSVSQSTAEVDGLSPGTGSVDAVLYFMQQKTVDTCRSSSYFPSQAASVTPSVAITSALNFAFVGSDPSIPHVLQQAIGNPTGGTYSWSASPSNRVSIDSPSADVVGVSGINPSPSLLDTTLAVTYTLSPHPTVVATRAITVRIFRFLQQAGQSHLVINGPTDYGYEDAVTYKVYTNPGGQLMPESGFGGIKVFEIVSITSGNFAVTLTEGTGATDPLSHIVDQLRLTFGQPLDQSLQVVADQDLFVAGLFVRNNTLTYTSSGVTVTNNGPNN